MGVVCDDCGHFFDQADERAFISKRQPPMRICPACRIMSIGSVEAWAVYNSCNGIFTCGVETRRADALARIEREYEGCEVVPVRVIREPDHRVPYREWDEREWEKLGGITA